MRLRLALPALAAALAPAPLSACGLALLLAVDVSGSVDQNEFGIQMQGIANGLRDPIVSEALVRHQAEVGLAQWTGSSRQEFSIPWRTMATFTDVEALAVEVEENPRRWRNYATAIGEAQQFAIARLAERAHCRRLVIDVSGDGSSNEGIEPAEMRAELREKGITVNALAIEGAEEDLTGYFWENVIGGSGAFVVTAAGFDDFGEKMRNKLRRETSPQISLLNEPGERP